MRVSRSLDGRDPPRNTVRGLRMVSNVNISVCILCNKVIIASDHDMHDMYPISSAC